MGSFSFVSFIITQFIILANEFDGIDAGRPKHGKKPLPPTVDWRSKLVLKIRKGAPTLSSCVVYTT